MTDRSRREERTGGQGMGEKRGAVVEIVDDGTDPRVLSPDRVLIDGHDVGLLDAEGVGIEIDKHGSVVKVVLPLLPSRVVIRGAAPDADEPVKGDAEVDGWIETAGRTPPPGHEDCPRADDGGVLPACARARFEAVLRDHLRHLAAATRTPLSMIDLGHRDRGVVR